MYIAIYAFHNNTHADMQQDMPTISTTATMMKLPQVRLTYVLLLASCLCSSLL